MTSRLGPVSGVVVNHRTPELTARAVRSLLDDGVEEVVVVENGSGDGSLGVLRAVLEPHSQVVIVDAGGNLGFGGGVNLGARHASGDLLFLLNSDATVEEGCTARLLAVLEEASDVAAVAPMIVDPHGVPQADVHGVFPSLRSLVLRTNRRPPDVDEPDWLSGAALLVRRSDFESVGGFDPRYFMYFEDIDLCRRLHERSRTLRRVRAATAVHDHLGSSQSRRRFLDQYYESQELYARLSGWSALRRGALRVARAPIAWGRRLHAR